MTNTSYNRTTIVFGVGISSGGKHLRDNKNPSYVAWMGMLRRCYDSNYSMARYYAGCTVCPAWLNYQTFADWYESQNHSIEKMEVDKDILGFSTVYSPETCLLIPSRINKLLINCNYNANPGSLPIGVTALNGKFRARCRNLNGITNSKVCNSIDEAVSWYQTFKNAVLSEAANVCKDILDPRAYAALTTHNLRSYKS